MKPQRYLIGLSFFMGMLLSPMSFAAIQTVKAESEVNAQQSTDSQVSINSASLEELVAKIKGIGLKKAQDIINYREKYGPFTKIEQLQEVSGIGSSILKRNLHILKL